MTVLTLQPDSSTGLDTLILSSSPTTNYYNQTFIAVGEDNSASNHVTRSLLKFSGLSAIPVGSTIISAVLNLTVVTDLTSNTRTMHAYRLLHAWTHTAVTWNTYDGSNAWPGGAGAFGSSDCEQTDIGNVSVSSSPSGTVTINLTSSGVQDWINGLLANNGILLKVDTEQDDRTDYASCENSTAANRPQLVVTYIELGGWGPAITPSSFIF